MNSFFNSIPLLFSGVLAQQGKEVICGISTDSRSAKKGDLFIPLIGEKFNGHQFIPQVLHTVSGVVLSEEINVDIPKNIHIFRVPDTLVFYQMIAAEYLKTKPSLKRIAITGSAGKTSTKEWLSLFLSQKKDKTYKTSGNFNNLIGVPYSALQITDEEIAIFELGTGKPADIKTLTEIIKPDISIVTAVGVAHLEFFNTLENIAKEKSTVCTSGKICYVPQNILFQNTIFKNFTPVDPKQVFEKIENKNELGFGLELQKESFSFPFFGEYNLNNLALSVVIALLLGVTAEQIAQTAFPPLPSYRSKIIDKGTYKIILDCYNANPLSMKESLKSVHHFTPKPTLILGDMLELGEQSEKLHRELGDFLNQLDFPMIFFVGEQMKYTHEVYRHPSIWVKTVNELKPLIAGHHSTTLFVKGSRGMHLEDIENE